MAMHIRGITVCVGYADLLEKGLDRWHQTLDQLVVVTSPKDEATQSLCRRKGVDSFATNVFYQNGAKFNKGAALSEAVFCCKLREGADWLMTFDADIVPPELWRVDVERMGTRPGHVYGAWRYWVPETATTFTPLPGKRMPQSWPIGFFMLFHNQDPHLPPKGEPLFDIFWPHAGVYDTTFARRWPAINQVILPLNMVHLGNERQNWCGRGDKKALAEILERRSRHEDWSREAMENPPTLRRSADGGGF